MRLKLLVVMLLGFLSGAPGIYQKKQFALDASTWTPIITVMPCNAIGIKNSSTVDMLIRTDSADATTEDTLPASQIEVVGNLFPQPQGGRATRFSDNHTVLYMKMSTGTGTAIATFLR